MDHRELAADLLRQARAAGADAADVLVAEGTDFSVTVRKGQVETLKEAGSKALGLRTFVGRRSATSHTSDFSPSALAALVAETVDMARVTGEDPAAGLPDEGIAPGTRWEDVPMNWTCPECGARKDDFEMMEI